MHFKHTQQWTLWTEECDTEIQRCIEKVKGLSETKLSMKTVENTVRNKEKHDEL